MWLHLPAVGLKWTPFALCTWCLDVIQAMAEVGMPLLIHGEVTTAGVDIFDKEARFIEEVIKVHTWWLLRRKASFLPSLPPSLGSASDLRSGMGAFSDAALPSDTMASTAVGAGHERLPL